MNKTPIELLKDLKKKSYAPIYLLHGDEPYYVDAITTYFEENILPEADQSFNQFVIFGKDVNIPTVLSYAKRFPMMSEYQVVIVKEAQGIQGIGQKDMTKILEDYAKNPLSSTILVLSSKDGFNENLAWVKAINVKGIVVNSKKMYDNKLPDWIINYCHERGLKISQKAVMMLAEFIGNNLKRLVSELDKISLNLTIGEEINAGIIEKYIGISKEFNVFEFQKALILKDVLKANQIIDYFRSNPKENPITPIILNLFSFFSKLIMVHAATDKSERGLAVSLGVNPYFVKDYLLGARNYSLGKTVQVINYLRKFDAKSKGVENVSATESELLKELTFMILH
jgi:DNA polymerase III subunit delta